MDSHEGATRSWWLVDDHLALTLSDSSPLNLLAMWIGNHTSCHYMLACA